MKPMASKMYKDKKEDHEKKFGGPRHTYAGRAGDNTSEESASSSSRERPSKLTPPVAPSAIAPIRPI
jgi:hypothetical protein